MAGTLIFISTAWDRGWCMSMKWFQFTIFFYSCLIPSSAYSCCQHDHFFGAEPVECDKLKLLPVIEKMLSTKAAAGVRAASAPKGRRAPRRCKRHFVDIPMKVVDVFVDFSQSLMYSLVHSYVHTFMDACMHASRHVYTCLSNFVSEALRCRPSERCRFRVHMCSLRTSATQARRHSAFRSLANRPRRTWTPMC